VAGLVIGILCQPLPQLDSTRRRSTRPKPCCSQSSLRNELTTAASAGIRQAAKEELRSIVKAWNDAFALEAFFTELPRRASALDGDERANLEAHIQTARELAGGQDAVDRFLKWKLPPGSEAEDEDAVADEAGDDPDDEDDRSP